MIEKDLESLGLSYGEAKAYLALLELGLSTVGPVAKKSSISYSKIYEVLQRLINKGFVSYVVKEKTKYFRAIEPNQLTKFLDREEIFLEEKRKRLLELIPGLQARSQGTQKTHSAEVFEGVKGLVTANQRMFSGATKKDRGCFFYAYTKEFSDVIDDFYFRIGPLYKKIGLKFKGIGTRDWAMSDYVKKTKNYIDAKYVEFPLPGTIDIFKDYVLQVAWSDKPVGILIHSKEIAHHYQQYFDEIWSIAKKHNF